MIEDAAKHKQTARVTAWIACALGLSVFPVAFLVALLPVFCTAAIGVGAWLLTAGRKYWRKEFLLLLLLLIGYFAPSVAVCWTPYGFCRQFGQELGYREAYLLAIGLLMYFCAFATVSQAEARYACTFGTALAVYVGIAVFMLFTSDHLSERIGPRRTQLFVTRNDLAPLVAWLFFLYGLVRHAVPKPSIRFLAFMATVVVSSLLTLATQSRLVAAIAILGTVLFAAMDFRRNRGWAILGLALGVIFLFEYQNAANLVRRAMMAEIGEQSILARFSLWKVGWEMSLDAPWLGHGLGTFGQAYEIYRQTAPAAASIDIRLTPWPHNVLIEVLFGKGIVGLTAFLTLLVWVTTNLSRKVPEALTSLRKPARFLFAALIIIGCLDSTTNRLWFLPSILYVLGFSEGILFRSKPT